ncbi:hypothetical protein RM780_04120 [Streptomyces sp. DSM 44917]|uniref:Uncharacterized protein n=1 Tax=Streptomyces boetiae TaxID=3075541 RepID=A0ABU2L499_9ACTN|nr:hypothetical protein [Streptomyces sp. DSM 44917]MDT0306148.1 hypothetical protein [Streptomyces sp. DSM 44917]
MSDNGCDLDLDWRFTQTCPGDPTASGWVPPVGEHILVVRDRDGASHCGVVDDNRCGLFLTTCCCGRAVLTAALWWATPTQPCTAPH